jgi:hypothetical protein
VITGESQCNNQSGTYQGDGALCSPNPCGPTGACCTDNFGCTPDLTFDECVSIGGLEWNEGQDCTSCPLPPVGACCNFDGTCTDNVSSNGCASTNGVYQGNGSTCDTVECPAPSMDLLITEVADGDLPGGIPKWVELTNCGSSPVNLGLFSLANFNNGATSASNSFQLTGSLAAGDSFVFEYDNPAGSRFAEVYGFPSDQFSAPTGTGTFGRFINGDDAIALFNGPAATGTVVDVYGVIGVDGTGQVWEHLDGYSRRNPGATPSAVFMPGQWTFGGVDSLDGGATEAEDILALQTLTDPGTHTCGTTPAATVTGVVTRKLCDLSDASAPFKVTEPRQGGVTQLRIGFDTPPGGGGTGWTLEQATCAAPAFVPYSGASVVVGSVVGTELVLTATPGLENPRTYRVHLGPTITSIAGQSVDVRGLIGDTNADGAVNSTDRSVVVAAWTGGGFSCVTDLNGDGATNSTDRSIVVAGWTGGASTNCAP